MAETPRWLEFPEAHDYPAALEYLLLIVPPRTAADLVRDLRSDVVEWFKAKDLFRASRLALLPKDDPHVEKNIDKIEDGKPLSPLLVVRDQAARKLIIADGYHRLCAVYRYDYDMLVPVKIAGF